MTVEADVGVGLSVFDIVGLPDTSVRESRERVRSAVKIQVMNFLCVESQSIWLPRI